MSPWEIIAFVVVAGVVLFVGSAVVAGVWEEIKKQRGKQDR